MACYRNGGCGPYENRPCNECPASKPEYARRKSEYEALRSLRAEAEALEEERKRAYDEHANKTSPTIKIKAFLNEDGVICVLTDADVPVEIEFIDAVAVENDMRDSGEEISEENDPVDAYINQLCADGFVHIPDEYIAATNMLH